MSNRRVSASNSVRLFRAIAADSWPMTCSTRPQTRLVAAVVGVGAVVADAVAVAAAGAVDSVAAPTYTMTVGEDRMRKWSTAR